MTWQFTLTGLLIGGLVGLTGMGGGALLTPILVIVFGFKPTYAVGTDILHGAVFKSFGAVRHRRLGNRSEEHTSELQSRRDLVCRLLLEKKKTVTRCWSSGTRTTASCAPP